MLGGPVKLVDRFQLDRLAKRTPAALFDELDKFPRWKQFQKGFFDTYGRGGDSLMGRYFIYRIHPFNVAEVLHRGLPDQKRIVCPPNRIKPEVFAAL